MAPVPDREVNLLGAAALAVADRMRQATEAAAGHGAAAPAALAALDGFAGGGTMDRLRSVLGLTASGAVRLVDRLAAAGLVERRPGADGRSLALVLTPGGRAAARRVRRARAQVLASLLEALPAADRAALRRANEHLLGLVTTDRLQRRQRGEEPGGWLCRLCDLHACGRERGECPAAAAAQAALP